MLITDRLKPIVDIINRFSGWVLLIAIGWLCWTAARLLWLLLAAPTAPNLPIVAMQSTTSTTDTSGLFAIFAELDPAAQAGQPPPNIILKGVLLALPKSLSSALLDVNGSVKNYRIGASLLETGYTLIAVDWNAIIVADPTGKQSTISLPDSMPLDQTGMAAKAVDNARLPDNKEAMASLPQPVGIPDPNSSEPTSENTAASNPNSAIDEAVTALQEEPASYLSRMGVMASGEGYQVTAAMPTGLRNRLGLEPGDKVLSVNGQNVGNNPGQDATILQQVQQAGEAQIEVQRGDQVITIRQQF